MTIARLGGRFALVTGASRGIGRAVAERFATEGATVAINYTGDAVAAADALSAMESASLAAGHGRLAHRVEVADIGNANDCAALLESVTRAFGRLDILVNNAGIQRETPGDTFDDADLERILTVNLLGAARCAREAVRHFLSRPGAGVVINTSSVHEQIPKPGYIAYSLSKGGLRNLTRTLALEFADRGIRVNAVAPGATVTDINRVW